MSSLHRVLLFLILLYFYMHLLLNCRYFLFTNYLLLFVHTTKKKRNMTNFYKKKWTKLLKPTKKYFPYFEFMYHTIYAKKKTENQQNYLKNTKTNSKITKQKKIPKKNEKFILRHFWWNRLLHAEQAGRKQNNYIP